MPLIIVLLVVGVLAIVLELIMMGSDGYASGIVGVLAIIAAAVLSIVNFPHAWIFVAIGMAFFALMMGLFFSFIRRKQLSGTLTLSETLAEALPDVDYPGLMGKEGKTVTILRPYGEADFNGVRVEVSSGGAVISVGRPVKVVDVQGHKVVVDELGKN